jgi:hypothetical protein
MSELVKTGFVCRRLASEMIETRGRKLEDLTG